MKRMLVLLMLLSLISFSACGGKTADPNGSASDQPGTEGTVTEPETKEALNVTSVGQEVSFGTYKYTKSGESKEVAWIVLRIEDGKALLLSKYALKAVKNESYDTENMGGYLNSLSEQMFTKEEKDEIVQMEFEGATTKSYLFLLDSEEVNSLMPESDKTLSSFRKASATDYAVKDGVERYENSMKTAAYCNWELRDSMAVGGQRGNAGEVYAGASNHYHYGVRPAMWVRLPGAKDGTGDIAEDTKGAESEKDPTVPEIIIEMGDYDGISELGSKLQSFGVQPGTVIRITGLYEKLGSRASVMETNGSGDAKKGISLYFDYEQENLPDDTVIEVTGVAVTGDYFMEFHVSDGFLKVLD